MCRPTGRPPSRAQGEPRFQSVGRCHAWNVLFREGQIRIPRVFNDKSFEKESFTHTYVTLAWRGKSRDWCHIRAR